MLVVVSSTGSDLDAPVSPIFGRCAFLVYVDTETLTFRAVPNAAVGASGGAGIQAAQAVCQQGAQAIISGNLGPNAMDVIRAAGLPFYSVAGGTVREAVEALKAGSLQPQTGATVGADYGKGAGRMGRGMWMGRNRPK